MADMLQPYVVNCKGGLVLNKSQFEMEPGEAMELAAKEFVENATDTDDVTVSMQVQYYINI